jgi:hypothetical protein
MKKKAAAPGYRRRRLSTLPQSSAGCDSLAQWERHARRRPVGNAVLIVADLPRNLEAEQIVVSLPTFHEELSISLVQHESHDGCIIIWPRILGQLQLRSSRVDD